MNKLIKGDCLKIIKEYKDNSIDTVITSPPYNLGKKYKFYKDNLTVDEYFLWSKDIINELLRITKNNIFWNIQLVSGNKQALFRLFGEFYYNIKEVMIWDKKRGEPAAQPGCLNSVYEFIIVFNKVADKRVFDNTSFHGTEDNILRLSKVRTNDFADINAATFPIDLPLKLINIFTKEGDLILDPFIGSGSTALACQQLKRNYIGIDIDEEIINIAEERLKQKTLF